MGNRIPLLLQVPFLAIAFLVSCQSTPEPEESEVPDRPSIQTAGWDAASPETTASPSPRAPSATDAKNAELEKEIDALKEKLRRMQEAEAAPEGPRPEEKVLEPVPARVVDVETVRSALQDGGVMDMAVSRNADGEIFVSLPGSVSFRAGKATLQASGQQRLSRCAKVILTEFPEFSMRVEGHTDSDPIKKSKWDSNSALSAARAQAVAAYLVKSCDFPGDTLSTTGHGATRPIADNGSKEGKAKNRRIELVLVSRTR